MSTHFIMCVCVYVCLCVCMYTHVLHVYIFVFSGNCITLSRALSPPLSPAPPSLSLSLSLSLSFSLSQALSTPLPPNGQMLIGERKALAGLSPFLHLPPPPSLCLAFLLPLPRQFPLSLVALPSRLPFVTPSSSPSPTLSACHSPFLVLPRPTVFPYFIFSSPCKF